MVSPMGGGARNYKNDEMNHGMWCTQLKNMDRGFEHKIDAFIPGLDAMIMPTGYRQALYSMTSDYQQHFLELPRYYNLTIL